MSGAERSKPFVKQPDMERFRDGRLVLKPGLTSTPCSVENDRVKIMLPAGRLERDVKSFFKAIGLEFDDSRRKYFIPVNNMPVDFVVLQPRAIPRLVGDPMPKWGTVGVTGSDILWDEAENTYNLYKSSGDDLPMEELVPEYKPGSLYIGVTNKFAERIREEEGRDPELGDLSRNMVVTKFPNITRDMFARAGINVSIYPVTGNAEAWQNLNQYFAGVVGVTRSERATALNDIQVLQTFYDISVRLISARWERYDGRISQNELKILDDLRELTYAALQKKGLV